MSSQRFITGFVVNRLLNTLEISVEEEDYGKYDMWTYFTEGRLLCNDHGTPLVLYETKLQYHINVVDDMLFITDDNDGRPITYYIKIERYEIVLFNFMLGMLFPEPRA